MVCPQLRPLQTQVHGLDHDGAHHDVCHVDAEALHEIAPEADPHQSPRRRTGSRQRLKIQETQVPTFPSPQAMTVAMSTPNWGLSRHQCYLGAVESLLLRRAAPHCRSHGTPTVETVEAAVASLISHCAGPWAHDVLVQRAGSEVVRMRQLKTPPRVPGSVGRKAAAAAAAPQASVALALLARSALEEAKVEPPAVVLRFQ